MERRLLRIRRWIDRSIEACRRGRPRDVVVELECAEAEMRIAREEILTLISDSRSHRISLSLKQAFVSILVAAVFLVALALPTSMEVAGGSGERAQASRSRDVESLRLSLITDEEERLIMALRKSLSDTNLGRFYDPGEASVAEAKPEEKETLKGKKDDLGRKDFAKNGKNESKDLPEEKKSGVSFEDAMLEDFLRLVRLGEKALKSQEKAAVEFSN